MTVSRTIAHALVVLLCASFVSCGGATGSTTGSGSSRASMESGSSGGESDRRGQSLSTQEGNASWYSDSLAGRHTASGVPYDPDALTAAHRTLPFGTVVRVTRLDIGASVEVTINDRGPYAGHDRIIDLSHRAAHALALEHRGVARVRVEVLSIGDGSRVHHHHHH